MKWRNIIPLEDSTLRKFEEVFDFNINRYFREFLLEHNGGIPSPGIFPTVARERKIARILDFSQKSSSRGAWAVNARLRDQLGPKRIVVGVDSAENFICIERKYKRQRIVVWSHVTGDFEECILDIPSFLQVLS